MTPPPEPTFRASDAEREHHAELLREHAAQGRLTVDELDERLDRVYAARTHGELAPVVADLPVPEPPRGPRRRTGVPHALIALPRRQPRADRDLGRDRRGLLLADLAAARLGPRPHGAVRASMATSPSSGTLTRSSRPSARRRARRSSRLSRQWLIASR